MAPSNLTDIHKIYSFNLNSEHCKPINVQIFNKLLKRKGQQSFNTIIQRVERVHGLCVVEFSEGLTELIVSCSRDQSHKICA